MKLTTITPYWKRPESLRVWLKALAGATVPEVQHLIYFVGEPVSPVIHEFPELPVTAVSVPESPGRSIGFYHNKGAQESNTEWIMKLDIDAIPNTDYFKALLPILETASPREWFNGGMLFVTPSCARAYLDLKEMPLTPEVYHKIMVSAYSNCQNGYGLPEASNFICRRQEYLELGGCDPGFKKWGWEDYQQMYMLERHFLQGEPIPGKLDLLNVTRLCREFIGRPKAFKLYRQNPLLCLLHRWHPTNTDKSYRAHSQENKKVLINYILKSRNKCQK